MPLNAAAQFSWHVMYVGVVRTWSISSMAWFSNHLAEACPRWLFVEITFQHGCRNTSGQKLASCDARVVLWTPSFVALTLH